MDQLASMSQPLITDRWSELKYHPKQHAMMKSDARFIAAFCGRRSGKTELLGLRKPLLRIFKQRITDGRYIFSEPTFAQAKKVLWRPLKQFIPRKWISHKSESDMTIRLFFGAELICMGMDSPERAEGAHIDGIVLDEYASMKPHVWQDHVLPGLQQLGRDPGWAFFPGTPEGRNHAYELKEKFLDMRREGDDSAEVYWWPSSDILPKKYIDDLRRQMDEDTFNQEMNGSFVNPTGRVYQRFDAEKHIKKLSYEPGNDLIFCFDFNVNPGTAVVLQEQHKEIQGQMRKVTCILDEVYIERSSTTDDVCAALIQKWSCQHYGKVICYGDPAGQNRSTRRSETDWDLIKMNLKRGFQKVVIKVASSDPGIAARINATNSRLMSADGAINMLVSPNCPELVKDFENVQWKSQGKIDKDADLARTHVSDALAYYLAYEFGVKDRVNKVLNPYAV